MSSKQVKIPPKMVVKTVYKSKDGNWRGFCVPFDISCTAETRKSAVKEIDELLKLYLDGLHKYGYPKHLTVRKISDQEDKKVFIQVLTHITKDVSERMQRDFTGFQTENRDTSFNVHKVHALGSYRFISGSNFAFA